MTKNDTCHRLPSLRTAPATQTGVLVILSCRDLCADGNHWTEGLELPHCSTLSGSSGPLSWWCTFFVVASSPRRVVFLQRPCLPVYRDLGTGSVVSACPYSGHSLALGVCRMTIHLCPCLHVLFICILSNSPVPVSVYSQNSSNTSAVI